MPVSVAGTMAPMANDTSITEHPKPSRHVSEWIGVPARDAYAYMADVQKLPTWAAGLAGSELRRDGDRWIADSPMGEVGVRFTPANDFGIVDHVVTLPAGEEVDNPLRVIRGTEGTCEVIFTVRHRAGVSDEEFEADVAAVGRDLQTLKRLLEDQLSG